MEQIIKNMEKKFNELEIEYELVENQMFIFDLTIPEIGITPRFLIQVIDLEDGYKVHVMSNSIGKLERNEKIFNILNELNSSLVFSKWFLNENDSLILRIESLTTKKTIVEDSFGLLFLEYQQIKDNYKKIMKVYWAD